MLHWILFVHVKYYAIQCWQQHSILRVEICFEIFYDKRDFALKLRNYICYHAHYSPITAKSLLY
jgi:hypothetical protein